MDVQNSPELAKSGKSVLSQTVIGVLVGLFFSGIILLLSGHPAKAPITINPTPTQTMMLVQVAGEVLTPGIYEVAPGSRWIDAINLAGGFTPDADLEKINAASFLHDGQSILIPSHQDASIDLTSQPEVSAKISPQYPLNINYCSQEELETLPGIGPQKASAIIEYRNQYGNFSTIEDIMNVPGIGETIFDTIKNLITTK